MQKNITRLTAKIKNLKLKYKDKTENEVNSMQKNKLSMNEDQNGYENQNLLKLKNLPDNLEYRTYNLNIEYQSNLLP